MTLWQEQSRTITADKLQRFDLCAVFWNVFHVVKTIAICLECYYAHKWNGKIKAPKPLTKHTFNSKILRILLKRLKTIYCWKRSFPELNRKRNLDFVSRIELQQLFNSWPKERFPHRVMIIIRKCLEEVLSQDSPLVTGPCEQTIPWQWVLISPFHFK